MQIKIRSKNTVKGTRKYVPRHTVAILRKIIALSQSDLAILIDRSPRSIQAIEIGKLKLSEDLAVRISHETGVDMQWLLSGDFKSPPTTTIGGLPFTKDVFENTQASISAGKNPNLLVINAIQDKLPLEAGPLPLMSRMFDQINSLHHPNLDHWMASILSSIFAAAEAGRARLAIYRLAEFTKAIREEFGERIDGNFIRDAAAVFENALLRVRMAGILVDESGPVPVSPPTVKSKEGQRQDLLGDAWLRASLEGVDLEPVWAELNMTGNRIKARRLAAKVTYEALLKQMQQVFAPNEAVKSQTVHSTTSKTHAKEPKNASKSSRRQAKG